MTHQTKYIGLASAAVASELRASGLSPSLDDLLQRAVKAFNTLTPEQQREHRVAQRKSWVVGEMLLSNPEMTRTVAENIYDQVVF